MTIEEAFSNRGLLVPENTAPVYRITWGFGRRDIHMTTITTTDRRTAKEELRDKWRDYAEACPIPEDAVKEIHCVANAG